MENATQTTNLVVLGNLTELVAGVVEQVAGEALATTVDGVLLSGTSLRETVAARIQTNLSKEAGNL